MEQPLQPMSESEPCAFDPREPCETCGVARDDHEAALADHDYEPLWAYTCAGCSADVVWDSDNIDGHPGYDHDFDPIEYTPRTCEGNTAKFLSPTSPIERAIQ